MLTISSYFSVAYMAVLLPVTLGLYAVFPQRLRRWVLLGSSYAFFWCVSGKLIVYLWWTTVAAHYGGLWLERLQSDCVQTLACAKREEKKMLKQRFRRRKRGVLAFGAITTVGVLLVLKYSAFFSNNLNSLLGWLNMPIQIETRVPVLPIGISFYTLQAMSYLFDIYWGRIRAEDNLGRMALYMSFFPQIMEGPICRYADTAQQLWDAPALKYENVKAGVWRMLLGMTKKIVVADRLNRLVQTVFSDYENYDGLIIALGAICYTVQLYIDFSGTMDLAIGTGQIFGIKLPENFRQPFFSSSISEFWRRWHITLGSWFKDYIYFPVSMSAPVKRLSGKSRKVLGNHLGTAFSGGVALLCVWTCNGLWHGAAWQYLFYGLYHFVLIWGGNLIEIPAVSLARRLGVDRDHGIWRGWRILRTTALVCLGELFFASHGLRSGFAMAKRLFTKFSLVSITDGTLLKLGLDQQDFVLVLLVLLGVLALSLLREKGMKPERWIADQNIVLRFGAYYLPILFIIIFGAYGTGYVPVDPMYASF